MKSFLILQAAFAALILQPNLKASLVLWDGSASASWTNGANWVGGSAPADDTTSDQAGFAFSILPAHEPNAGNHEINGLAIGDGTTSMPSFEISGSRITLGDSGIVQNPGASNTTISTLLEVAAAQTWTNNSAGTLLLGGRINNNGFDLAVDGNGTTRSTERIEGAGAIVKNGTGTLVLEGTNTFTGGTVLSGGTLRAGEGGRRQTLGADTSSVTFNGTGATLQLAGSIADDPRDWIFDETGTIDTNGFDLGINGSTSGAAGLVKTGGGTLTINTTASQEGGTVVRAGGLVFGSAASIAHPEGDLVVGDQDGDSASLLISGADVETNWSILGNAPGSTGNASMESGSWLVKGNFFVGYQGDGSLSLSGGNATVDFYQFHVGSEGNGTFQMAGGNFTNTNAVLGHAFGSSGNASITGGRWTNTMNLFVGGDGAGTLSISGNGAVAVGDTLNLGAGSSISLDPGGTLEIGLGGTTGTLGTGLAVNGHLVFNRSTNSTHTQTLSGSGNLSQNGSATLTLSAGSDFSGNTFINSGTLSVAGSIANSTVTASGGGTLAGTGTVGNTTVASGGRIAPGNSPGIIDTGDITLAGGGGYNWEIASVSGTPGTDWDLIRAGGGLGNATITATPSDRFTIFVEGNPTGWNPVLSYSWDIIDWGTATGFDADAFAVDLSGFSGAAPIGVWSLANAGGFLTLDYLVGDPEWSGGSGNWSTGFVPPLTEGAAITFTGPGGNSTNDIPAATISSIGGLVFAPSAGAYTLAANPGSSGHDGATPLTLGGNITNNSSATQTLGLALDIPGTRTFQTSPGNLTLTGPVSGAGTIVKTGSGSLLVQSSIALGGNIEVQQGLLTLNGNSTLNELSILAGARLGGTGTINGNLLNRGTVAPGNSIGTLATATFTQTSTGSLEIEVAGPASFDRLVVGGLASLAGTLDIVPIGGAALAFGQSYAFLEAGSISGAFDTINTPAGFRGRFVDNGTTGTLLVAPSSYTQAATTPNQNAVAAALDTFIPATTGDRLAVSTALDGLTASEFPAAFEQIGPGFYENLADLSIEQAFVQAQLLAQRLGSLRAGVGAFQTIGLPEQPLRNDIDGTPVGDFGIPSEGQSTPDWSAWVLGSGSFTQAAGYRNDAGGFLGGADHAWGGNFSTGLYAGYQFNEANPFGGSIRGNSVLFGGYGTVSHAGYYADAIIGGAYTNYQTRRPVAFGTIDRTARAQPGSGQFTTALNLGKDWNLGAFTAGPILGAQYTYAGIGGFTESGADSLDLSLGQQDANSFRTTLGGRIAYTWNPGQNLALIPEVRMLWLHEFLDGSRTLNAALDGGSGAAFGFDTANPNRNSAFAGAGLNMRLGQTWTASAFYNVDFGTPDFTNNIISLSLSWNF